jgi:hypothetical protein
MSPDQRAAIRREAFEEAAKAAERYGEINFEIVNDNILMDPLLRGQGWSEENVAISRDCSIQSTIHSAKYHACRELAEQFRGMS